MDYRNGFFIEVGANNGTSQSNTRYFEMYKGWKGLLIEAVPELAEKCNKIRRKSIVESCALVGFDYHNKTIEIHYCNLMSMVHDDSKEEKEHINSGRQYLKQGEKDYFIRVPAFTLTEILEKNNITKIDFLSLDVEGYEYEVLTGIDFNKYRPKFMLIEVRDELLIDNYLEKYYMKMAVLHIDNKYHYSDVLYRSL